MAYSGDRIFINVTLSVQPVAEGSDSSIVSVTAVVTADIGKEGVDAVWC